VGFPTAREPANVRATRVGRLFAEQDGGVVYETSVRARFYAFGLLRVLEVLGVTSVLRG
jgi:hypothetical protein